MNLRPYQSKGIKDIYEAWQSGYRSVMFQLSTGGGKSIVFMEVIREAIKKGKRVMLIAHREELISQAWQHLYNNQIYAGIIKGSVKTNYSLPAQVASIQTISRRKNLPECDLIIVDEAHHVQDDNSYGKILNEVYGHCKVLGVTATPYRLSGDGFTDIFDTLIQSVGFGELVKMGFLCPTKYFIGSVPDLKSIGLQSGDYNQSKSEKAMELAPIVESYFEHCEGMSGALFAVNIHHSESVVKKYLNAGVKAAHLDANTKDNERKAIVKDFKSGIIKIVSNVGIFTEGFDFPGMEFVQLARPTKSLSMYLQMIGRVTRIMQGKEHGIVLDNAGLYIDHPQAFNMVTGGNDIDWQVYFNGWKQKRKEDKDLEKIEIIEFVAEDEQGRRFVGKQPEEVAGMKLIEVNKTIQERVLNITSLKEFDRLYAMFHKLPKVKKVGYTSFFSYLEYCEKHRILIGDAVWDYLEKKLVLDKREKIKQHEDYYLKVKNAILESPENYSDSDKLIAGAKANYEKHKARCEAYGVASGFLKKQRKEYEKKIMETA